MNTSALVRKIKTEQQDFEWYPTTEEILSVIKSNLVSEFSYHGSVKSYSILDCGAGDGRALMALKNGEAYAIEKSKPLLEVMDREILIIGSDFEQQTLIDKDVDVIFSNPPYSRYEQWAAKIIREARAGFVYLVIPQRWESSHSISQAIKDRKAESKVIGEFDFLNAERAARAKVHVIKIILGLHKSYMSDCHADTDPFQIWFKDNFKVGADQSSEPDLSRTKAEIESALVPGSDLIQVLENLYLTNMQKLIDTFQGLANVDAEILKELNIDINGVAGSLKAKIKGMKNLYWNELFSNFSKVTSRLTKTSREKLLETLTEHTQVDFSADNAYAVMIWVIKNANHYFDSQLVDTYERMIGEANIINYKSNLKTFGKSDWQYCKQPEISHIKLDYRIVLDRCGGICTSEWRHEHTASDLEKRSEDFLDDLRTIATNIGFDTANEPSVRTMRFESGKKNYCYFLNHGTGKREILFEVKAFKNKNMHLKLHQAFICKLNVEFGRLKGWINSPSQAAEEMDITYEQAAASFRGNLRLTGESLPLLGWSA